MPNFIKELEKRCYGFINQHNLESKIFQNHLKDLHLSELVDFESLHTSAINSIDVDKTGRYLLSGSNNGSLLIHDLHNATGNPHYRCQVIVGVEHTATQCHNVSVETVQWFPFDSGLCTTSGMDKTLRVWDAEEMNTVDRLKFTANIYHHHMSSVPSTSPLVAVAMSAPGVKLVDLRTGACVHELKGHLTSVMGCAWSPVSENLLATGGCDAMLNLWDTRSSKSFLATFDMNNRLPTDKSTISNPLRAHNGFINGVAFSPNGRYLVSSGTDDQIRCWDVILLKNTNQQFEKIPNRKNRSFKIQVAGYENYNVIFAPCEGTISIFEIETGKQITSLSGHYNTVNTLYFDQKTMDLYSAGSDHNILLWSKFPHEKDLNESPMHKPIFKDRLPVFLDDQSDDDNQLDEDEPSAGASGSGNS